MIFLQQLKWQLTLLQRNRLIGISVLITVLYGVIFYFIRDLPNVEPFLTLLIYNDPAIIGMFFIGLGVIMESNSKVLPALFVTPINYHSYLVTRIIALTLVGTGCAAGMTAALLGLSIHWGQFLVGVGSTCILFSLAGIFIVSFTQDFLTFMLRSIPILLLLSLPMLNYFGLTSWMILDYMPLTGSLHFVVASYSSKVLLTPMQAIISLVVWIPLLYTITYGIFVQRVIKSD